MARLRPSPAPSLPLPDPGPESAMRWVDAHLAGVCGDRSPASPAFRGGQTAADEALAAFDVRGYARARSVVWPPSRRGASRLSPWIRHGLLPLPRVWQHVEGGPAADVRKFRDELLWQEYARHLYARLGPRLGEGLRREPAEPSCPSGDPADVFAPAMACLATMQDELLETGWLVNQARMWVASHWSVRRGADWRLGEEWLFRHLLDGSRAANRLGWQWTSGVAGGRVYGFSRWQVEKRAPALCAGCELRARCPIERWPDDVAFRSRSDARARLSADPDLAATAGPAQVERRGVPEAVWLTAESLGDADPALASNPDRPAVFVFDEPLLARLRLSRKRLVFLVETLGDLAQRRPLELYLGNPAVILRARRLAATRAPVPGWRRRSRALEIVELHPWRWLVPPHAGPIGSYSAWRKRVRPPGARRREASAEAAAGLSGRRQR